MSELTNGKLQPREAILRLFSAELEDFEMLASLFGEHVYALRLTDLDAAVAPTVQVKVAHAFTLDETVKDASNLVSMDIGRRTDPTAQR